MLLKIFILLGISTSFIFSYAMDARKIIENVNNRHVSNSQISDMKMTLLDKSLEKKVRKLKMIKYKNDKMSKSLLFFNYPPDVKGSGFLTYDYNNVKTDDRQWLYLPALKRIKQITSSERSKSFMGSDFTYGDMKEQEINHFKYRILKSTKVKGKDVWVIEALPINNKIAKETGYAKSILYIQKNIYFIVRAVHFSKQGKKQKYYDVKNLKKIGKSWIATQMSMTTRQGKKRLHQTIITLSNIKLNTPLNTSLLSLRGLKSGI